MTNRSQATESARGNLWWRWIVPGVALSLSGFMVIWAWREDRQAFTRALAEVRDAMAIVEHRLDAQDFERSSTLRVLDTIRENIERLDAAQVRASLESTGLLESGRIAMTRPEDQEDVDNTSPDDSTLPDVPRELNPRITLRQVDDVTDLLKDERLNPGGKQVDELTLSELRVDFARARGEVEVLEAETYHELTHARAALRERGEYIEYAQGEKYATQPGTLTAAEPLPGGGVRMFYLSQAEFPELYAKRAERDARAERSLREILKRMNDL